MKSILVLNWYVLIVILGAWRLMYRKEKLWFFEKEVVYSTVKIFTYNGNRLEVVNDFNYLGTVFNYKGNFSLNQQQLVGKCLKTLNVLPINCCKYKVKPIIPYKLFGFSKSNEIKRIHLTFCKKILLCKMNTPTTVDYGELGRYPLYISRYLRILEYWFRLIQTYNISIQTVYKISYEYCLKGKKNWVSNVK